MRVNPGGSLRLCVARPVAALALLMTLALAVVALAELDPSALCLLPALALFAPLLLRRYPGERTLARLSAQAARRWRRPRSSVASCLRARAATPRGGLLLACSLAVRPPPRAARTAS